MKPTVEPRKETHGGRYDKPWIVLVNGQPLRDNRGGQRRYKTEGAARSAGWKSVPCGVLGRQEGQQ